MRKIKFWKMSGAGNDFVLLTGGRRDGVELKELALKLCDRKAGIGADGLLYVNGAGTSAVGMRYFNSDGSEAFCGNGSRCSAWWAYGTGLIKSRKFTLKTISGELPVEIAAAGSVKMRMPDVQEVLSGFKNACPPGVKVLHFLNTGVPHAVLEVKDLERADVRGLGRSLRHNRVFGPAGANVDFVKVSGGKVLVRTYERGVEGETLACGTGIAASAVALAAAGRVRPPVALVSRSGDKFRVWFKLTGRGASDVFMQGPAGIVFQGEIKC